MSVFDKKFVELDFNSNLVSMIKISSHSKILWRFGMHFNAMVISIGLCLLYKIWGIFTIVRPFLDTRTFFHNYFGYYYVFKMKLNNFLVESFKIGISFVIEF